MNKKFSILLAALALIASTLACAAAEPTLSNVRTARDAAGDDLTSVFSTGDTVYVVSDLTNGKQGNVVKSIWTVENVEGYEPGFLIDEVKIELEEDKLAYTINFYFEPPAGGWPVGSYKVDVYFNDVLNSTVTFSME